MSEMKYMIYLNGEGMPDDAVYFGDTIEKIKEAILSDGYDEESIMAVFELTPGEGNYGLPILL